MYLDYLKGKKDEVNLEISSRKDRLQNLNVKIKEKYRFIEYLDKESTTPFTEFTPQVITAGDKRKKEEIQDELSALEKQKESLQDEIVLLETEFENINSALSDIKKAFSNQKKQIKEEKKLILKELVKISDTVIQDPMRASIEIKNLLNQLESNS